MTSDAHRQPTSAGTVAARALLFGSGALVWAAPWMPGTEQSALRSALAPICHQLPERTIVLAGYAMPVCSRCAGVYAGVALGALFAVPHLSRTGWRFTFAMAAFALLADVLTQTLGLHPVWHASRLLTGAACGYAASAWLVQEAAPSGRATGRRFPALTRRPPLSRARARASGESSDGGQMQARPPS
jgi:uncharacterized membrane protein